ncbi:MAG: phosphoribosylamine--glycine ligase [Spartobacteria bacterium]|nr:phosphoribosylamine--glycine ligase [Spartobacteria bacterium]
MKILIVGGGGREHALAWKLGNDSRKPEIFCAPGNAGTAALGTNVPIAADDIEGIVQWARENKPSLTVVGPEAPLCAGLVDRLSEEGFKAFGPSRDAARLEGSKIFAKEVMQAAGVPTAKAGTFSTCETAFAYIDELGAPVVVKADGLAAGKGVTVCATIEEARQAVQEAIEDKLFGDAGNQVLIEECLAGEEASILALIDGTQVVMLASSQDHKRAYDGDKGPNTGGMGAYSPAPVVTPDLWPVIKKQVFDRTLAELKKRGITYKGVLYAGVMMTADGPKVLEFNCRFGDPETQVVLPRWKGDAIPVFEACVDGTLNEDMIQWHEDACVCVVVASGGYPGTYAKGKVIRGLEQAAALDDVVVFHAGTKEQDGQIVTAGGRVLGVTALGTTLRQAVDQAYNALHMIDFDHAAYRTDIAWRAL